MALYSGTFESGVDNLGSWFGCTVAQDTADAHTGSGSLLASALEQFHGILEQDFPYITISAGTAYDFTFWHKLVSGSVGSTTATLTWYDSGVTTVIGTSTVNYTPGGSWAQASILAAVAPVGASKVRLDFSGGSATVGSSYRLDDVTLDITAVAATPDPAPFRWNPPGFSPFGRPQPWAGTGADAAAPTAAEQGVGAAGLTTTGTASKVAPQRGTASIGAIGTGTARKLAPQLGSATTGATATGLDRKVASQSGSGAAGLTGTGTAHKVAAQIAAAALGATGLAVDRKVGIQRGTGALGTAGAGTARKVAGQIGTSAAGFASTRSSTLSRALSGVATFGATAYGTARKLAGQGGAGTLGTTSTGTARKLAVALGTSALGSTGSGSARKVAVETGMAAFGAGGVGAAVKRALTRGLAALGVTGFGATAIPPTPVVDLYAGAGVDAASPLVPAAGVDAASPAAGPGVDTTAQLYPDG